MKEIPMLFSTPMVQAILAFLKNMTRRVIKDFALTDDEYAGLYIDAKGQLWAMKYWKSNNLPVLPQKAIKCPYGKPGDILWIRETWQSEAMPAAPDGDCDETIFRYKGSEKFDNAAKWRPSIHMPKIAARIWLQVTDVRVERLQDISAEDILAEGIGEKHRSGAKSMTTAGIDFRHWGATQKIKFQKLWEKINGAESWEANPFCWVISFKVLSTNGKPDLHTLKAIA